VDCNPFLGRTIVTTPPPVRLFRRRVGDEMASLGGGQFDGGSVVLLVKVDVEEEDEKCTKSGVDGSSSPSCWSSS
jgi:hypothetical protein